MEYTEYMVEEGLYRCSTKQKERLRKVIMRIGMDAELDTLYAHVMHEFKIEDGQRVADLVDFCYREFT